MKILILLSLFAVISCSKGGGGGSSPPETISYNAEYEYPENDLEPGEGTRQVQAQSLKHCFDNKGNEVEHAKCKPLEEAPELTQQSPAGQVAISVTGAVGGEVMINVLVGENVNSLAQLLIEIRIAANLSCAPGYTQVNAECKIPGFELTYSAYTTPTKTTACTGSEFLTRTITGCINNISLAPVNASNCTGLVDSAQSVTYASPAGTRQVVNGANTETYTCAAGELGGTQTDILCGSAVQHKAGLVCVDDLIVPTYSYPADATEVCGGPLTVDADAVTDCYNSTKNTAVSLTLCPMPTSKPTQTYHSDAGTKNVVNGANTEIYTCAADEVGGTITDIVCGTINEHKVGTVCVPDTLTPSGFTYPANSLTAGYGSDDVAPNGFTTCTNEWTSSVVDNSYCSIPGNAPTTNYLSPAGDVDFTIANAVGGKVTLSFAEGEDFYGQSLAVREAAISAALTCENTHRKINIECKLVALSFFKNAGFATCVKMSDNTVKCWGNNYGGTLGTGNATNVQKATEMAQFNNPKDMAFGHGFGCMIAQNDKVYCVGANYEGQLGLGTISNEYHTLTEVTAYAGAKKIYAGQKNSCAIMADNTLKCSGNNDYSQMGVAGGPFTSPVTIAGFNNIKELIPGNNHNCGIMIDNTVKCTGYNNNGQLGNGVSTMATAPVTVANWGTPKKMVISNYTTCAIMSDDAVRCSGYNTLRAVGDGTTAHKLNPTLNGITNAVDIWAGSSGFCAKGNTGTVNCWGYDSTGQFATGASGFGYASPQANTALAGHLAVMINNSISCVITPSYEVRCSGSNSSYELGNELTTASNTLTAVTDAQPE